MIQKCLMFVGLSLISSLLVASPRIIPAPPQLAASGYLLMDADSGEVLVEFNSQQRLPPASLTKIMTSYVVAQVLDIMNQQAKLLGMVDTHFVNATGLPDEAHYTTASDLARLTVSLINDHPKHYGLYSEKYFSYNDIRQPNRNLLLWRDKSVDGVKTGHTDAAGYCLVASAMRDGMRLVSVVMGAQSEEARAAESQKLLSYGFRYYETLHLYAARESLNEVRVWGGEKSNIHMGLANKVSITIPRGTKDRLTASMDIDRVMQAPIIEDQTLGQLTVSLDGATVYEAPLVALSNIDEAGFFQRLWDTVALLLLQLFSGDPLKLA